MNNPLMRNIASLFLSLTMALPVQGGQTNAQSRTDNEIPVCDETRALLLVQTQVDEAKSIENAVASIAILIRSADALWQFRKDAARDIFTKAYELAERNYREQSETTRKESQLKVSFDDQRFVVMEAISRHDAAWARLLAKAVAEETQRASERRLEDSRLDAQKAQTSPAESSSIADKLLGLASSTLPIDQRAARDLAAISLRYPPSFTLAQFLFKLAASDQEAADQLYLEAIKAYANSNIQDLILLSAYPFGSNRIVIGVQAVYLSVPPNFAPNLRLQRMFLEALFHRAETCISASHEVTSVTTRESEPTQVYMALSLQEPLIAQHQPGLLERAATLKGLVKAALYSEARQQADDTIRMRMAPEDDSFASYIEKAERATVSDRRDYYLASAVMKAPGDESLGRLKDFAQKISDPKIRQQLLNWLYFKRTQKAIKESNLDDASQLAEKVEQLDLRAYLSYEIAVESLRRFEDKVRAREVLDAVAAKALKTDNTNEKARTLLGVSHLYSKIDHARAFEVMSDAVKTINRITAPDLNSTGLFQRIQGPQFGYLVRYEVTGFRLENAFRELAPFDFDGALLLAKTLEDGTLRSTAIIAIAAFCLEKAQKRERLDAQADKKQQTQKTPNRRIIP